MANKKLIIKNGTEINGAAEFKGSVKIGTSTISDLNTKQDVISDLDEIRAGAELGATAIQPEAGKGLFSGSYNDLSDKPSIPSKTSELENDGEDGITPFLTEHQKLKTINNESILGIGNLEVKATAIEDSKVLLSETIYTDKTIGHIEGSSTHAALVGNKGDTLKQVFTRIFGTITEMQPTKTDPSISSLTFKKTNSEDNIYDEYGTKITTINYSLTATQGSYSYGPSPTGVSWTKFNFTGGCASTDKTSTSGELTLSSSYTVGSSSPVSFTCVGTHGAGSIAKTNLGNNSNPEVKITAGTKSKTNTFSINAKYYNYYMCSTTTPTTGTAEQRTSDATSSYEFDCNGNYPYLITRKTIKVLKVNNVEQTLNKDYFLESTHSFTLSTGKEISSGYNIYRLTKGTVTGTYTYVVQFN